MKNVFLLFSVLMSFNVFAGSDASAMKPFSIGAGLYRSVISLDVPGAVNDEYSGIGLTFGYAVSDNISLRGTYFSLEHDDLSALESKGIDLLAYVGTGLATQGFKAYIGGGYFKDSQEISGFSESFSGLQLSGGLGYNWESVSLDLIIGIRDSGDYEDFYNSIPPVTNDSITVASGSLLLSYRF